MSQSIATQVAGEYLTQYPNLPSRQIARMMFEREQPLFTSVEKARDRIRWLRGQKTAKVGRRTADKTYVRDAGTVTDGLDRLPEPIQESATAWAPQRVDGIKNALVISDIHVPFHNLPVVKLALGYGKLLEVDCVLINGDLCDFYGISFFDKDPRLRNFPNEVKMCREFLAALRGYFPRARIVMKEGNHEERYWRYLARNVPDLCGLDEFGLRSLLRLDEYGMELVDRKQPILLGDHLYVLHGHEFRQPMTNPVNPARGLYLRTKANALCGDLHQTSQHSEAGLEHVVSCWSIGCLCQTSPQFMPINKWNLGFAVVHLDGSAWSVENKKIIAGHVV